MTRSPAATSRIHESLDTALARKRVVLWYDPNGEWASEFDDYQPAAAEKLRVEGNEFSVKVAISRASLVQRFLLYLPCAKPPEPDNWLLDLLLAGHEFTADRASLDIQEAGLALEFKELAQLHAFSQLDPTDLDAQDPVDALSSNHKLTGFVLGVVKRIASVLPAPSSAGVTTSLQLCGWRSISTTPQTTTTPATTTATS